MPCFDVMYEQALCDVIANLGARSMKHYDEEPDDIPDADRAPVESEDPGPNDLQHATAMA